jgi:hypothetical protein
MIRSTETICAFVLAFGTMVSGSFSSSAQNLQTVVGVKTKWTAQLTGDWIGGNLQQMKDGLNYADPSVAEELKLLIPMAENYDVVYAHFNFPQKGPGKKDGLLKVRPAMEGKIDLSNKQARDQFWKKLADTINQDEGPAGSQTRLEWEKPSTTGGFSSYAAAFRLSMPSGVIFYFIRHFVLRQRDVHQFELGIAADFPTRTREFDRLISSVRYTQ